MIIFSKILKLYKLPVLEKIFLIEAFILCLIISLLTKIIPPKYYLMFIASGNMKNKHDSDSSNFYIRLLRLSINRVNRVFPWRLTCLVKSICFKLMSYTIELDCVVSFNVISVNGKLVAHSSVKYNNQTVYLNNNYMEKFNSILNL
jgi:hypothetical protein